MTTLTIGGLEAKYVRRRRYLRKVLKEFKMKVDRQEAGRLYGLFKALLAFMLINEQKVAALEKENGALKARIAKMVSPTTMHFLLCFPSNGINKCFLIRKNKRKNRRRGKRPTAAKSLVAMGSPTLVSGHWRSGVTGV